MRGNIIKPQIQAVVLLQRKVTHDGGDDEEDVIADFFAKKDLFYLRC